MAQRQYTLPPGATQGVKLPDGAVYYPNKRGRITVENPRHIAQLSAPNSVRNLDMIREAQEPVGVNMPDRFCTRQGCFFNNVSWVSNCARCGTSLESTAEE